MCKSHNSFCGLFLANIPLNLVETVDILYVFVHNERVWLSLGFSPCDPGGIEVFRKCMDGYHKILKPLTEQHDV